MRELRREIAALKERLAQVGVGADTARRGQAGGDRPYIATLRHARRYGMFGTVFVKGVPQPVTAEQAATLRDLRTQVGDREVYRFEVKAERTKRKAASRPAGRTVSARGSATSAAPRVTTSRDLEDAEVEGMTHRRQRR